LSYLLTREVYVGERVVNVNLSLKVKRGRIKCAASITFPVVRGRGGRESSDMSQREEMSQNGAACLL
jgi:hypothetical protein